MLALKASIVHACGIRGGKLFHDVIVLGKELYLNVAYLCWQFGKVGNPVVVYGSFVILVGGIGEMVYGHNSIYNFVKHDQPRNVSPFL